ncbi:hypothetical protein HCN51_49105 [Nonomuraea sp. FMUSA5-5]|uniref:DUF4232 domain-containing protein n=1 Tax=Nonomuraea composti TaxID=2720023 RepID=A0ABX1BHT4_9ACTN|nr:hypothetical protein [Nonomuraea sp. FMUSA5-5]NJP97301.1 hypothetical protein [Nonomuraea sp. FMUSA5-5]
MKRKTPLLVTAVIAAACGSGCGSPAPSSPPSTAPPPGVSVSLAQYRSDEPVHALQIAVRNTSETPVYFADVQLVAPSFETLPPRRTDAVIRKTERTDLPVTYGAAKCLPQGLPEVRPATVVAHVRPASSSEPPRKVIFQVPHPDPLLARLLRDECSEHLIKQSADITFGPTWTESGPKSDLVMRGTLVITRRGPGTVTITDVGGTTHYIATPSARPLGTLSAGAQRLEVPLQLTPGACTGHAFAEAKKAFLFPVRASVDGGTERVVIVTPPKPLQDRLITYAHRACGTP